MEGWVRLLCAVLAVVATVMIAPGALEKALDKSHVVPHERVNKVSQQLKRTARKYGVKRKNAETVATDFRLSFSLIVDDNAAGPVGWSVEDAEELYFEPFLKEIGKIAEFRFDSQVLYFSKLSREGLGKTQITEKDLESFMSTNGWNANSLLGSEREQTLHFMMYLPNYADFTIQRKDGSNATSFTIPRWGGIYVLPIAASTVQWIEAGDLAEGFEVFRSQLCHILHIAPDQTGRLRKEDITRWTFQYLSSSVETLGALDQLIRSASQMIVQEKVSILVTRALDHVETALQYIESGSNNEEGMLKCLVDSRNALRFAEQAFFHPSLLPQLYFPPEHWVAVYLPYLLPALLPVAAGIFSTASAKMCKKRKEKSLPEKEKAA